MLGTQKKNIRFLSISCVVATYPGWEIKQNDIYEIYLTDNFVTR